MASKVCQATQFRCADCGTELTGVAQSVGRRKKDRKVICRKCYKLDKQSKEV